MDKGSVMEIMMFMTQRSLNRLKVLCGLGLVLLLSLGGLMIYLKSMDFNAYKPLLKKSVLTETGRALDIDGSVELHLSLNPLLIIEGLHLANVSGGSRANMINIKRMEVQLSLLGLLEGKLEVDRVVLVAPDIWLETVQGVDNWTFDQLNDVDEQSVDEQNVDGLAESESLLIPHIDRFVIRDAQVNYHDSSLVDDLSLQLPELEMRQLSHETRFSIRGSGEVRWGEMNRHTIQLSGMIDDLPSLLANKVIELSAFEADFIGLHASFSGTITHPLDGQGIALNVVLETDSVMQAARASEMKLPRDFPLHLALNVTDTMDGFQFSKLQVTMADNDISGQLQLNLMEQRPALDGVLYSTSFDVTRLLAVEKKEHDQEAVPGRSKSTIKHNNDQRLFSSEVIDFSVLKVIDVTLGLKVKRLKLPELELTDLDTRIKLKNGVLALKPFSLGLAEGNMTGSLKLRSGQSPVRLSTKMQFNNIHPSVLLPVEKGEEALIVETKVNAEVKFSSYGQSIAEMMAHGDGVLLVKMGKGRVQSKALRFIGGDVLMNLVNTLNPFSEKMSYNALECGVVHFRLKDGDMITRKGIAFETDRMNIISSGHVNLGNEKINLSINTETREGLGLNLTNMVNVAKLGGTLMDPGVGVDVVKTGMVAARTVGAFATGGLSLLGESLLNRVIADSTPCETALKMAH